MFITAVGMSQVPVWQHIRDTFCISGLLAWYVALGSPPSNGHYCCVTCGLVAGGTTVQYSCFTTSSRCTAAAVAAALL